MKPESRHFLLKFISKTEIMMQSFYWLILSALVLAIVDAPLSIASFEFFWFTEGPYTKYFVVGILFQRQSNH